MKSDYQTMSVIDKQELLFKLAQELREEAGPTITPLHPYVLVRVLPKESQLGRIIIPDKAQNKVIHEGVVLATYESFYKLIEERASDEFPEDTFHELVECQVNVGDHVIFPHIDYNIVPVPPLDDGKGDYRLVYEDKLLGKLTYAQETTKVWIEQLLIDLESEFDDADTYSLNKVSRKIIAEKILERANVVRKDLQPRTFSGR